MALLLAHEHAYSSKTRPRCPHHRLPTTAPYSPLRFTPSPLPGAPLYGTWRTQVQNALGFLDYAGTGIGFLLISRPFARQQSTAPAVAFLAAGALMLLTVALLSPAATFPVRGLIQRLAEVCQFTGVFFVCHFLSKTMTPKRSPPRYHGTRA
ncbi:MAG: hypothetical protein P4N60_13665 [Verrucomicrobiae bacterium]|nr:hypothetical protein [Verrucomicrobiae bacterium]